MADEMDIPLGELQVRVEQIRKQLLDIEMALERSLHAQPPDPKLKDVRATISSLIKTKREVLDGLIEPSSTSIEETLRELEEILSAISQFQQVHRIAIDSGQGQPKPKPTKEPTGKK